jgi:hypothetical protein
MSGAITGVTVNAVFTYGILNSSYTTLNMSLASVNNFSICINGTIGNYTLSYGEMQYSKTGYSDNRYYLFEGTKLTQTPITTKLYLLLAGKATSFLFTFNDAQLAVYAGRYAALLHWYPSLDSYIITNMMKLDDKGQSIGRVIVEDVDYRVALYNPDGTLIKLANPVRFACLATPCSYTLTVIGTEGTDYLDQYGTGAKIAWNKATQIFTLTWNDPTQAQQSFTLLVTKLAGSGSNNTVCQSTAAGFTGALSCDLGAYTSGTFMAEAIRTASPDTPLDTLSITLTTDAIFKSPIGLVISFMFVIAAALMGIFSPVAAVVLVVIGLIPAIILGSVALPLLLGIALLGGVSIHLMKKSG